jgi:hypothetical protein
MAEELGRQVLAAPQKQPDLLTTQEVADIVRAPAETVRYWRHVGKGPRSVRLGLRVLYDRRDVERWIEKERVRQEAERAAQIGGGGPNAAA